MVFKVCGIKVEITFLFVAFITLIISLKAPANLLITVVSSLLHEAGHLFMMVSLGERPKLIKFELVGMNIIRNECYGVSSKGEIAISLGGPIMNFFAYVLRRLV